MTGTAAMVLLIVSVASACVVGQSDNCKPGDFDCGDGRCIPGLAMCDSTFDCGTGIDEDKETCKKFFRANPAVVAARAPVRSAPALAPVRSAPALVPVRSAPARGPARFAPARAPVRPAPAHDAPAHDTPSLDLPSLILGDFTGEDDAPTFNLELGSSKPVRR